MSQSFSFETIASVLSSKEYNSSTVNSSADRYCHDKLLSMGEKRRLGSAEGSNFRTFLVFRHSVQLAKGASIKNVWPTPGGGVGKSDICYF